MWNEFRAVHISGEFRISRIIDHWTHSLGTQRGSGLLSSHIRYKETMKQKLQMQKLPQTGNYPQSPRSVWRSSKNTSRFARSQKCSSTVSQGWCSSPQPESWTRKSKMQMCRTGSGDQREPPWVYQLCTLKEGRSPVADCRVCVRRKTHCGCLHYKLHSLAPSHLLPW